jgi:4-amino-4-deoxy-L-arabinose transferase-like glycosyltransferase
LLIFAIAAGFMTFRALAPPTDWDSLTLHLRVPTQFLEKGNIYLPEDNLGSSFVQFVHMWYVPLLAFGSTAGPSLLSSFFALLLCLSAFAFSIHFLNPITASLSLAFFWANAVILLVAITPRVDVTLAFFLFAANYSLIKAIYNPLNFRCYYLSAVLFGISIGIKYNAFFYILAVSPLVFSAATSGSRGYSWCLRKLFIFGSLMAMSASPWLIKNIIQFHSPLYPFFAERQLEPWLADSYFNLSLQSSIIKSSIANSIQQMAKPFNLPDFIKTQDDLWWNMKDVFIPSIFFFLSCLFGGYLPGKKPSIG